MFTYLWNDIYENLVVKSVGLNLFSLLGSSSSSSVDTSSFGCVVILSLYFTLNFVISSLIVGTFKSACMTLSDIYHGAFTIARRTLFRYLCNISLLELLAVPQRVIPYVQSVVKNILIPDYFVSHLLCLVSARLVLYERMKLKVFIIFGRLSPWVNNNIALKSIANWQCCSVLTAGTKNSMHVAVFTAHCGKSARDRAGCTVVQCYCTFLWN
jgi:hypothetical protein